MTDHEDLPKRIPLEEIDEHIQSVQCTLNRVRNSIGGETITEPKLEAILNILTELTSEVRRIRDASSVPHTAD